MRCQTRDGNERVSFFPCGNYTVIGRCLKSGHVYVDGEALPPAVDNYTIEQAKVLIAAIPHVLFVVRTTNPIFSIPPIIIGIGCLAVSALYLEDREDLRTMVMLGFLSLLSGLFGVYSALQNKTLEPGKRSMLSVVTAELERYKSKK